MSVNETGTANVPTTHPKGFFFIFWGEFAERCCYYGMRAILFLSLPTVLSFPKNQGNEISSYFKAACYLMPLLGGFLADRYFGKYWTIVGFAVFYVFGQFILLLPNRTALFVALGLLALGSGVIKPNISTLLGLTYDQKRPGQLQLRTSGFMWFYFSVNVGAVISQFSLPHIRRIVIEKTNNVTLGFQVAFLLPAILMIAALIVFAAGKKHYAVEVIQPPRTLTPEERKKRWNVLSTLFGIFGLMVFFWMAYEQNDNLWVGFAQDNIATNADKTICPLNLGFKTIEFTPDGFQFINALCVLIFIPSFTWVYKQFDKMGMPLKPTAKILTGFILMMLPSLIMASAASQAATGVKVSAWYLVFAYITLTAAEVLIYGTGLELAFSAAPDDMKSFITACFLLTNTAGNLLNSQFLQLYGNQLTPPKFFFATAGISLASSIAFYFVGKKFEHSRRSAETG